MGKFGDDDLVHLSVLDAVEGGGVASCLAECSGEHFYFYKNSITT